MKVVEIVNVGGLIYVKNSLGIDTYVGMEAEVNILEMSQDEKVSTMDYLNQGVTPAELIQMKKAGLV